MKVSLWFVPGRRCDLLFGSLRQSTICKLLYWYKISDSGPNVVMINVNTGFYFTTKLNAITPAKPVTDTSVSITDHVLSVSTIDN